MKKIATFLLLLTGCTMEPKYIRPELPVAKSWNYEKSDSKSVKKSDIAAQSIAWKDFFLSPNIRKVITIAIANNRDLRVAALNVQATQALYRVEKSDLLPNINAGISENHQKITKAQNKQKSLIIDTYTANLAVTAFEADLFGRLQSQNKAALEQYFATKAAYNAVQISLIAETANMYLQWLADRKILELTQQTLNTQQKSYDLISTRYKAGTSSKLDLMQVGQAVETAKANLYLYKRQIQQDENSLLLLMGVKSLDSSILNSKLDDTKLLDVLPSKLSSEILVTRPDVQQAEHELISANANIGAARAAFFPKIQLTGSFGYASSDLKNLFSSSAFGAWNFIPQISLPIFEGGRNVANLDYAVAIKNISVANYEKTLQTAFKEVADELVAYNTLSNQLLAQDKLVKTVSTAYNLSYIRYKEGLDTFLNALDSQRSLFAAQQQKIDIQKQKLANLVNLYKVLGGGED